MKAMILAAGRGERMRPLTDTVPKPLLMAGTRCLIEHHLIALARSGITDIVINHAHLGAMIQSRLGDGARYGTNIRYSPEGDQRLETGGGIKKALPLLGEGPFIVINADIWTDFPFDSLLNEFSELAHIVLVPNPAHHPDGDFGLLGRRVVNQADMSFTYSGIGVYRPELFADCPGGAFPLAPLLRSAADQGRVSGTLYQGAWKDIGTPRSLAELRRSLVDSVGD